MLARFFVDRPIFAWVISIVIVLIGAVSALVLPVDQYPEITPPTVSVMCTYPGANAAVVAESVAAPIEQQVNGVERMLYMSSQCTNDGQYALTVTFQLGTDLNMAQVLVQNRVALAMPQLPPEVQVQGVVTKKKSPSILLVVNIISPDRRYDSIYLSNFATIQLRDELLRIEGVGDISSLGQRDYSMRVWLDPNRMAARNLTANDVIKAIKAQNVQVAAGQIGRPPIPSGQQFQYTMSTLGRLVQEDEFADIIIKTGLGNETQGRTSNQVVRLRDVARVELGAQQYDQTAQLDGQPTIGLAIFQLPGSNALATAERIKAKMAELKRSFPEGIDYEMPYDTTPFVEQSVHEVFVTLRDAVILVAIVVLLFLQDWRAMILPMIDVPVALVGTFAVMVVMGFTLNNLTLFGLVLAIGIVVDDAIVVLENVERMIGLGYKPREATIRAMDEVTGPIVAITLILCSVFLPSAFLPGISGQFYRQFALTIASAMIISAINAMTLTPARAVTVFGSEEHHAHGHEHVREAVPWWFFGILAGVLAYMLGPADMAGKVIGVMTPMEGHRPPDWLPWVIYTSIFLPVILMGGMVGWFINKPVNQILARLFKWFNRGFDWVTEHYGRAVARMIRVSAMVLLIYCGLLYLTYSTMKRAPVGFIPIQDQGYLLANIQLPDAASVERTTEVLSKLQRIALGDDTGKYKGPAPKEGEKRYAGIPGVAHTSAVAGMSFLLGANGSNFGSCFIILDSYAERKSPEEYDEAIANKLRQLVGQEIDDAIITVFRAPPIRGLGNAGGYKFQVEQRGFVDFVELQNATDELVRELNQDPRVVGAFSMYRALTPQYFIDIDRTKCESLKVNVSDVFEALQVYMGGMYVNLFNKFGRTWQVNVMADEQFRTQPDYMAQIKVRNKLEQMVPLGTLASVKSVGGPVMVMRYNMYPSASVNFNTAQGVSSDQAIKMVDEMARKNGVPYEWTEIVFMQIMAGNVTMFVFGLGTLLVYLVLAAKYESWRLPLAVILVVPMCLLCAVTGMLIMHLPIDIFVQIGFLVLVGLAAKNAVLIVEFAEQLRREGKSLDEAIVESSRLRFRPIIMTSFAFILGVLPLVLSHGAGAEMRRSLGTAVFSGMIGVTVFGVFLTPVFYYAIMKWSERLRKKRKPAPPVAVPAEG